MVRLHIGVSPKGADPEFLLELFSLTSSIAHLRLPLQWGLGPTCQLCGLFLLSGAHCDDERDCLQWSVMVDVCVFVRLGQRVHSARALVDMQCCKLY
jgi:hypothetical protein